MPSSAPMSAASSAWVSPRRRRVARIRSPRLTPDGLRVVAEEPDDPRIVPRERPGAACLPEVDGLLADSELEGKGSLPLSKVEPLAADVVTYGA